jgi:hypothetical protein
MIMFSRQVSVAQLAVVGGHLDTTMLGPDQQGSAESREEEQQLRVLILDNRGELFLWQNNAFPQLTRFARLSKLSVHSEQMRVWKFFSQTNVVEENKTQIFFKSYSFFHLINCGGECTKISKLFVLFCNIFCMNAKKVGEHFGKQSFSMYIVTL